MKKINFPWVDIRFGVFLLDKNTIFFQVYIKYYILDIV